MKAFTKDDVRWMIRSDLPNVVALENECFDDAWTEDDFLNRLRKGNCIGLVVVDDCEIVRGFVIYELQKDRLCILNFAGHSLFIGRGVMDAMLEKLVAKLSAQRRSMIDLMISERQLALQFLLKNYGFRAEELCLKYYGDGEDGYRMVYRIENDSPKKCVQEFVK